MRLLISWSLPSLPLPVVPNPKDKFPAVIFEYLQANLIEYPTAAYIIDDYERQLEDFGQYGFVEQYSTHVKTFDTVVDHLIKHWLSG